MVAFNPKKRITVEEAMNHPFFSDFKEIEKPLSEVKFEWEWDNHTFNESLLKKLVYMESLCYHPEG